LISRRSDPAIKKTLSMMVHSCFFCSCTSRKCNADMYYLMLICII
jgi:hypothetical protein